MFIAPPSHGRAGAAAARAGTDSDAAIATRLAIAETELAAADEFDLVVVNDVAERAAAEVAAIIGDTTKGE